MMKKNNYSEIYLFVYQVTLFQNLIGQNPFEIILKPEKHTVLPANTKYILFNII